MTCEGSAPRRPDAAQRLLLLRVERHGALLLFPFSSYLVLLSTAAHTSGELRPLKGCKAPAR